MKEGWIKKYRSIQDHWLYPTNEDRPFTKYEAWDDLLFLVCFEKTTQLINGRPIVVNRGEYVASNDSLQSRWKWSNTKVRSFIDLLINEKMISKRIIRKKTILNVLNYDKYQNQETIEKPKKNHEKTIEKPLNKNSRIQEDITLSLNQEKIEILEIGEFGNVQITYRDFENLRALYMAEPITQNESEKFTKETCEDFDTWLSRGHTEPNHYAALRSWVKRHITKLKEEQVKKNRSYGGNNGTGKRCNESNTNASGKSGWTLNPDK
ncbi:MAG: hypothetical protein US20_C0005G0038 [Candidatus Pacebacteria bacterium GW2011_GWF1_36_5]|nr:MAG: hypothetical protein US20_C0005G0038 [Candidatus Pacebacteria bacterium GW2011_GWF1_36_5]